MEPDGREAEAVIAGYNRGDVAFEELIQTLVNEKMFLLLDEAVEEDADGMLPPMAPLTLNDKDGATYVAVYTSSDMIKNTVEQAPEYQYGFQVPFGWILGNSKPGCGVLFNPFTDCSLDIAPETVDLLRQNLQQA